MYNKSISKIITVGNCIIAASLILLFIIQHTSKVLEQNDVDSRLQAKELTRATLAIQKMSDDMTSTVRSYIFTGDRKHKKIVLKISDFMLPENTWPANYHSYLSHIVANTNYLT